VSGPESISSKHDRAAGCGSVLLRAAPCPSCSLSRLTFMALSFAKGGHPAWTRSPVLTSPYPFPIARTLRLPTRCFLDTHTTVFSRHSHLIRGRLPPSTSHTADALCPLRPTFPTYPRRFSLLLIPVPAASSPSPHALSDYYADRLSWKWINTVMRVNSLVQKTVILVYVTIPSIKDFPASARTTEGALDFGRIGIRGLLERYAINEVSLVSGRHIAVDKKHRATSAGHRAPSTEYR
jgi:hypothetical protein